MSLVTSLHGILARLLPKGGRVLVATSGGPDSQALLDILARAKAELGLAGLYAAGVDHRLRKEAARELDFAEELARRHEVPFARLEVDVPREGNVLANARRARYRALRDHMRELGAAHLAVAHTATDQAETILMHLARGAGLAGAGGMPWRRADLVRPLLGTTRAAVASYLAERGLSYASDPSNHDLRRARARLRATVLPELEALYPGATVNIGRFSTRARQDEAVLHSVAQHELKRRLGAARSLAMHGLAELPAAVARRVVALWLCEHELGYGARHLKRLVVLREGSAMRLPGSGRVIAARESLWATSKVALSAELTAPGRVSVSELGVTLVARLEVGPTAREAAQAPAPTRVAFDADRLHLPLWVRPVRPGDRLSPFGLRGTMKVGDLFTNAKMPRPLRAAWPLVCSGDEVAWVVGIRRGALAPVTDETRHLIVIEIDGTLPWSAASVLV